MPGGIAPKILSFIANNRVCSLAILLKNGTPHSASMHYSHQEKPLTLFFSVDKTSRKCQAINAHKKSSASVVIGFSEEEWITLQMDGRISLVRDQKELKKIKKAHYRKNPGSKEFENDPNTVFLEFKPRWLRYTDFNTSPPTIILPRLQS